MKNLRYFVDTIKRCFFSNINEMSLLNLRSPTFPKMNRSIRDLKIREFCHLPFCIWDILTDKKMCNNKDTIFTIAKDNYTDYIVWWRRSGCYLFRLGKPQTKTQLDHISFLWTYLSCGESETLHNLSLLFSSLATSCRGVI